MRRCLELASLGAGQVAPNPMVGAVLVHDDRIIGEGFHKKFGEAHAEVNCINSVNENDRDLIPGSTIYVSLEPCAHFGKTPPCADLIIHERIPRCIVALRDPFPDVNGKGIEKLLAAGVDVKVGILEDEARELNKRFFRFHINHRPYIILKWAQTADGYIGAGEGQRLLISNEYSNRLVHRWRSEEAAILVGTRTAELDNPALTTRLWPGSSPVRLVVDMNLRLSPGLHLFDGNVKTIVFNTLRHDDSGNPSYYQVTHDTSLVHQICNALYQMKIQSVLVEGGARLLQSFIDEQCWDEARIITNRELYGRSSPGCIPAPELSDAKKNAEQQMLTDTIEFFQNTGEELR